MVYRLQQPLGALANDLGQIGAGPFSITHGGFARFAQHQQCQREKGDDQQNGESWDKVKQKTLSRLRALVGGWKLRRHGNRSEVTSSVYCFCLFVRSEPSGSAIGIR